MQKEKKLKPGDVLLKTHTVKIGPPEWQKAENNSPKHYPPNVTEEQPVTWNGKEWVKSKEVQPYPIKFRKLSLNLFGVPMPKQSVRSFDTGKKTSTGKAVIGQYQPKDRDDRKKDYIEQIKNQLPKDFVPFETEVFVTKFHCIYPPLKSFQKIKGRMDAIREGAIFYKNTQPDLIDNLKKLVFDCLGKQKLKDGTWTAPLVLGNDGIVVGEDNTRKYYGIGGAILIELEGY
jgi:Holliday junction resolvase RusA-like endonuclease